MRMKISTMVLGVLGLVSSSARGGEFQLKVGETRVLEDKAQGATLDNPRIADIRILKDSRVQVAAKGSGEGTVSLYTADGKLRTYQLRVVGGEEKGARGQSSAPGQKAGRFGGSRILDARCEEPLEDEDAASALQEARDLLRQEHVADAIKELQRALTLEPDAAVVHLYLGSAWAKLSNQAKGASSYETFVLSCPDDANAKRVARLLREFERRSPLTKPKS